MTGLLLLAGALLSADPAGAASGPELSGAFGISLLSDAGQLPEGFTELPRRVAGGYRVYQRPDPDQVFDWIQISASPLSNKVLRVAAFKEFAGSSSFHRCLEEYRPLKAAIEKKGLGMVAVPFFQVDEPDQLVSSALTTELGTGSFGSLLPWGRWVRIACQAQDEGATLSVDYNVNSHEQELAFEQTKGP